MQGIELINSTLDEHRVSKSKGERDSQNFVMEFRIGIGLQDDSNLGAALLKNSLQLVKCYSRSNIILMDCNGKDT